MPFQLWLAFVATSAVLLVIPGPVILTVISYSMAHGRRANVPLVAAVALGDSTSLVFSLLGLGALLARPRSGSRSSRPPAASTSCSSASGSCARASHRPRPAAAAPPISAWRLFANTYLVTALNPKGMVFFVAFLPQFLDPRASATPQLWILGVTFVVMATLNATLYAVFAGSARRLLASPRAQRGLHLAGGSLLTGAGIWALLARRPS